MAHCNSTRRYRRRKNQRGFALLLVFLMAAVVAITLYMEIPRLAMQAQRDKEQTLIDRGEQYKRAIQLFVHKYNRFPGDIKELENTQNQRFLRHRYIDPMTGKDEWRLIHVQNGMLTDSKLTKPTGPGGKDAPKAANTFVTELAGLGSNPTQGTGGGMNVRDRRRSSEGANASMPGPSAPGGDMGGGSNSGALPLPGQPPDGSGTYPAGNQPVPGQPVQPGNPGQPGFPGQPINLGNPGQPGLPGQTLPGQPGPPVNSQTGGMSPYPTTPGANGNPPGFPQPGTAPGQGNAAADMIRNILTTPRPGGMPTGNPGVQTIGGGIAGVASTAEGEGVKVYNDRTLYEEWEFIFDPAKQKRIPNPNAVGAGGTPADRMGNMPGGGMGTPIGSPGGTPMGNTPMGGPPMGGPMGTPMGSPTGR